MVVQVVGHPLRGDEDLGMRVPDIEVTCLSWKAAVA
jgi:hypothetical protein